MNEKILQFIIGYIQKHGYSPSFREIAKGVGVKSTNTVSNHLMEMFADGIIETDAGFCSPRAIRVPGYKFVKEREENVYTAR